MKSRRARNNDDDEAADYQVLMIAGRISVLLGWVAIALSWAWFLVPPDSVSVWSRFLGFLATVFAGGTVIIHGELLQCFRETALNTRQTADTLVSRVAHRE